VRAGGGQRVGAAAESASGAPLPRLAPVTIAAVGDTMLGSTPDLPPDPGRYLAAVRRELGRGAQIVFGNLEGTLTTATASKCASMHARPGACFAFRDPPGYVRYLKRAGFTIFSDANPHSFDFGPSGEAQTVATIHRLVRSEDLSPEVLGGVPVQASEETPLIMTIKECWSPSWPIPTSLTASPRRLAATHRGETRRYFPFTRRSLARNR
jgi:hypothetical protein